MDKIFNESLLNFYIDKYSLSSYLNDDLLKSIEIHTFNKCEFICRINEELFYMYFLVEGKYKVTTLSTTGKSLLLCFNTPLSIMGDIELIDNPLADCNVESIENCLCLAIPLSKVKQYGYNDPVFLRFIISSLEKKLRRNSNYMTVNMLSPLENRFASYLVSSLPLTPEKKILVDIDGINNLCELLGSSYRHLNRIIKKFSDENIIRKYKNTIEILNLDKLNELAQDIFKI